ncbi:MAG: UPF0158 family protein [Candidatus Sumerlaeota bacterium]|nr:UPF0158 family protein [Candidatus Sumerlaeota bacterium]
MGKLRVDFQEIALNIENSSGDIMTVLDKETGDVIPLMEYDTLEDEKEIREKIEAEPERYPAIEPLSSSEGYRIMEDFVTSLPQSENKEALWNALQGKKPFRGFKDALFDMGSLREQWFAFHDAAMREYVKNELLHLGIEAEFIN